MPKPIPSDTVVTIPDGTVVPLGERYAAWQQGDDKWDELFREAGYVRAAQADLSISDVQAIGRSVREAEGS